MYSTTTIEGNLTRDPHLRRGQDGTAHLTFAVMVDRSVRTATGWEKAEPTHHWVKVFGPLAENAARSLSKGDLVIVAGSTQSEPYVSGDQRRIFTYVLAQAVGPSLRHTTARPQRATRGAPAPDQAKAAPPTPRPPAAPAAPVPASPPATPAPAPRAAEGPATPTAPAQLRVRNAVPGTPE